ncbi:MAG: hypothetical protein DRJ69_02885 [Thermoprotei archaeon]|nr:MAG: hypothetical protein DRJ69_02885 [Thermoprotei archaeon]
MRLDRKALVVALLPIIVSVVFTTLMLSAPPAQPRKEVRVRRLIIYLHREGEYRLSVLLENTGTATVFPSTIVLVFDNGTISAELFPREPLRPGEERCYHADFSHPGHLIVLGYLKEVVIYDLNGEIISC